MSTITLLPIKGYENDYSITSTGKVFSIKKGKFKELKQIEHNGKQPYYYVGLCRNGKKKNVFVHRLVALHFLDNSNDLPQVNHKDGNVHNNDVNNLEWVTNAENTQHAYDTFLNKKKQLHIEYNGETHSLRKWCDILNLPYKSIWYKYHNGCSIEECFNGKRVMQNVKC